MNPNDNNNKSGCDRRGLIKGIGAAAAGLAFLPFVRGRQAKAAPGPTARARRLLIINLAGGVRSSAAFHASTSQDHNPYGLMTPTTTPPFALGRILDDTPPGMPPLPDADYQLPGTWAGAQLPRLREIANQFSVLGTYSTERGDHLRARVEEPTGSASQADPGILTRIAAGLDAAGMTPSAPPFHVQPTALFGNGLGALTKFVPVSLQGYYSLPSAGNIDQNALRLTGRGYAVDDLMRDQFDQTRINTRHGQTRLVTSTFALHRVGARVIGARLSQPDMAVGNGGLRTQTFGTVNLPGNAQTPLENGMLFDLFTRCIGPTGQQYRDQAINAALAIRLLQLGSPAVTLEIGNFDFHSGERQNAPALYGFLGRLWAALRWLLDRIPDPSGEGTLFDRTTVVTMSDFGRDKATGGWNGGDGTDHGADYACFYLAHAMMGGGVVPNKLVGPVDTNTYNATSQPVRYSSRELLVTLLDSMGFDPHDDQFGLPAGGMPIGELFA